MIKKLLTQAFNTKSLIGIRTTLINWDELIIGNIIKLDDVSFNINEIDEYGVYIGVTIINIEDLTHIVYQDSYLQQLKILSENNTHFDINKRVTVWSDEKNYQYYFSTIKEQKKIATFFLEEDNYVTGIITDYNDDYFLIEEIGSNGEKDGYSCYLVRDLIGIRYNGLQEQKTELLYNYFTQS